MRMRSLPVAESTDGLVPPTTTVPLAVSTPVTPRVLLAVTAPALSVPSVDVPVTLRVLDTEADDRELVP